MPKYGYLLETNGVTVGAILLICSEMRNGGTVTPRCNLSSWYVDPPYRIYASLLVSHALRNKDVTYLNVSAAPHTWPIIEAQGFSRYSEGIFICVPALIRASVADKAEVFDAKQRPAALFDAFEQDVLRQHAEHGCISLWCATAEPPSIRVSAAFGQRLIPCAQLIYCRDIADFARFAGRSAAISRGTAGRSSSSMATARSPASRDIPPRQQTEIFQRPATSAAGRSRLHRIRNPGRLAPVFRSSS